MENQTKTPINALHNATMAAVERLPSEIWKNTMDTLMEQANNRRFEYTLIFIYEGFGKWYDNYIEKMAYDSEFTIVQFPYLGHYNIIDIIKQFSDDIKLEINKIILKNDFDVDLKYFIAYEVNFDWSKKEGM